MTDVTLTGDAAKRIAFLMREEGENAKLRIEVQGGGCSGFPSRGHGEAPGNSHVDSAGAPRVFPRVTKRRLGGELRIVAFPACDHTMAGEPSGDRAQGVDHRVEMLRHIIWVAA